MKPFYLIFICLFFVISCKNATEQKVAEFLENFPKLEIPLETKDGKFGDVSALKEIEIKYLDLFTDTAGKFIEYGEEPRYKLKYSYFGAILLPDKPYDIVLIHEDTNTGQEDFPTGYKLCTISKNGKISSSINFANEVILHDHSTILEGTINEDLSIETTAYEKRWDLETQDNLRYIKGELKKYKITDDGIIELFETIEGVKETADPKLVKEFLKQFPTENFPKTFDDRQSIESKVLKLHGFDFLRYEFPEEILYEKYDPNKDYMEMPGSIVKFKSQENFHLFVVSTWDNGEYTYLYTMGKDGKIIDKFSLMEGYGTDEENITVESAVDKYQDTIRLTSITSHYTRYDEKNQENPSISESISKHYITKEGKFVMKEKHEYKSNYLPYNEKPKNFHIHNKGIGSMHVGMKIKDIKERLPNMTTKILWVDMNMGNLIAIEDNDVELKINNNNYTVSEIQITGKYTTEKGIGIGSTLKDIKEVYTLDKAEIDETEGSPYYILKVKELPNLDLLINEFPPDNYWEQENVDWNQKISDATKVTQIYINMD